MRQPLMADSPAEVVRRDRLFFPGTAIALTLIFAVGFSWSTYVRTRPGAVAFGGPTLLPIVRWHATITSAWMLFLILQTLLIGARRISLHRRLGVVGCVLAPAVVLFGWLVTFHARPLSTVQAPGFLPVPGSVEFAFIPTEELFVFTLLIGLGLYLRRNSAAHKRLMLLGTLALISAGTTRIPLPPTLFVMAWYGAPEAIVVALLMRHDMATRRGIHDATLWGGTLVVVGAVVRFWIAHIHLWGAIAAGRLLY